MTSLPADTTTLPIVKTTTPIEETTTDQTMETSPEILNSEAQNRSETKGYSYKTLLEEEEEEHAHDEMIHDVKEQVVSFKGREVDEYTEEDYGDDNDNAEQGSEVKRGFLEARHLHKPDKDNNIDNIHSIAKLQNELLSYDDYDYGDEEENDKLGGNASEDEHDSEYDYSEEEASPGDDYYLTLDELAQSSAKEKKKRGPTNQKTTLIKQEDWRVTKGKDIEGPSSSEEKENKNIPNNKKELPSSEATMYDDTNYSNYGKSNSISTDK